MGSKYCAPCKGGDFQWVQSPPGDELLQPAAAGAEEEATYPSKPLMERIALGDSASMQAVMSADGRTRLHIICRKDDEGYRDI